MLPIILASLVAACPEKQYESLVGEIGDGSTVGVSAARSIRDTAYRLIDSSRDSCEDVVFKLEELAFDMGTLIENKRARK